MKLDDPLMLIPDHDSLINVGIDDHHDQPETIEISNTSQTIFPLPGDPGIWLIDLTNKATMVMYTFRSNHNVWLAGAKAGVIGIATTNRFRSTAMTWGGHGTGASTAYNMVYSKAASALNLSDKIFASTGADIALLECYIIPGTPARLHTEWINYSAGLRTLNVWGQIAIIG